MAKTRFFQHLNENEKDFQQVTTLEYIDNSDGFSMYYFEDGSKCNKTYIAPVNANSIEGYEFAEVSSPHNVWKLNKVVPVEEKRQTAVNADGELVESLTLDEYTNNKKIRKTRIDVLGKPLKVNNYEIPNDDEYSIEAYMNTKANKQKESKKEKKTFDFNNSNAVNVIATQPLHELTITPEVDIVSHAYELDKNGVLHIKAKDFLQHIKSVQIDINDSICELSTEDFIENAITPKEEKIVEKVVEKEVVVKTSDTDIDLGIDNIQKGLLDNMIDMSNKMECSIDMELTLKLPPTSVYKLIKSVYPEGMDKGFVNILANRMQVKELKESVAVGLLSFYNDEYVNDNEINNDSNNTSSNKKHGRKKQA